jgi:hypothetical protein
VFSIGWLWDPGSKLGIIDVFTLEGEFKKEIDLNEHIKGLENLSDNFSPKPNFPWLSSVNISSDQSKIDIVVCNQKLVTITVQDLKITVTEQKINWSRNESSYYINKIEGSPDIDSYNKFVANNIEYTELVVPKTIWKKLMYHIKNMFNI